MTVTEFLTKVDHPLKNELLELCDVIRASDKTLTEQIKWNAPSFCHNGDDRITFNLSKRDALLLIFHRGAKAKKVKFTEPILTRNTDLLDWPAYDRAVMRFSNADDVKALKGKLKTIVKEWIAVTSAHAA